MGKSILAISVGLAVLFSTTTRGHQSEPPGVGEERTPLRPVPPPIPNDPRNPQSDPKDSKDAPNKPAQKQSEQDAQPDKPGSGRGGGRGGTAGASLTDMHRTFTHIVVRSDAGSDNQQGTIFRHLDRTYLSIPRRALDATESSQINIEVPGPEGAMTSVDNLETALFRAHPDAPDIAILDITDRLNALAKSIGMLPLLEDPANLTEENIRSKTVGTFWNEEDGASGLQTRTAVGLAKDRGESDCILLDPDLPPDAEGAPVLLDTGTLVGIGKSSSPESGNVQSASSAKTIQKVIEEGSEIGRKSLRNWGNLEGLNEMVAFLRENELDRVLSWRIVRLKNGRYGDTYTPSPTSAPDERVIVAVLSEDPKDDLNLSILHAGPPKKGARDEGTDRDAAVDIEMPSEMAQSDREIYEPSSLSSARVLVIEAVGAGDGLQPLESLASEAAKESETSQAEPAAPDDTPPEQTTGQRTSERRRDLLLRIPLHGTVGAAGDTPFFTAEDFRTALTEARELRPAYIVLDIDSPGGRIDTKEEILRNILEASAAGERFVAVVRDAGSCAALIALGCHEIYAFPAARIGSAVTVLSDGVTTVSFKRYLEDDPELEAKYRSFSDAMDKEAALALNRSPAIANAMKDKARSLWWSKDFGFTDTDTGNGAINLDDADDVLTLTTTQLLQTGLGKRILKVEDLPQSLGLAASTTVRSMTDEMNGTQRKVERLLELIERQGAPTPEHISELQELVSRP